MAWRLTDGLRKLCLNSKSTALPAHLWSKRCYSTIFVSRLSFYTTEERLRKLFSPFGFIKQVRLITDRETGRPKGYAFVNYGNEEDAEKALKSMNNKIIDGRLIFVEIAKAAPEDQHHS